jgi:hypothetical protein
MYFINIFVNRKLFLIESFITAATMCSEMTTEWNKINISFTSNRTLKILHSIPGTKRMNVNVIK